MRDQLMDAEATRQVAQAAAEEAGLDGDSIELIRIGTNAVYRLHSSPTIVRVAPAGTSRSDLDRQLAIARWLSHEAIPATRALDVPQPVDVAGRLITFWESVSDAAADDHDEYGSTTELGQLLRRLHDLPTPGIDLPSLEPIAQARDRLAHLPMLDEITAQFLGAQVDQLAADYSRLTFPLRCGPIHGDANVGNLLKDHAGNAVLADLDGFSNGPREWDLVLTAMYTDLYGWHTEAEYRAFADAYGWDIRTWDGYPVLRDLRELLMVLWLAGKAETSDDLAAELAVRLESLTTGAGRENWRPL